MSCWSALVIHSANMARCWNPCSVLPRRLQIVVSLTGFLLFCIVFLGTSNSDDYDPYLKKVPFGPQIQSGTHQAFQGAHQIVEQLPHIPKLPEGIVSSLNPFRDPVHQPPPEQANSTSGETRWYSTRKWRNPFSSSVTLDQDRAVLPPVRKRPPIYTYFDPHGRRKDEVSKRAEQELLQIWRRAWWAQGFRPVVLGLGDANQNPLYRNLQGLKLGSELTLEFMRWLAWDHMGTGILCNWLALPMGPPEDPLLTFLRRGEYPELTSYEGLENGLFVGSKVQIRQALEAAIDAIRSAGDDAVKYVTSISEALSKTAPNTFTVDSKHESIAFYSAKTIKEKYPAISEKLDSPETRAAGLTMLPRLINSHLHSTWQNTFSSGIAVLKPLPQHTTALIGTAIELARNLSQCAESPIQASCPPNRPKCKPCISSQPMTISTPAFYENKSTLFTIGAVPHPYTMTSLFHMTDELSVKLIRRESDRDPWILATMKQRLGAGLPSYACLVTFKDAVASQYGSIRSLWFAAEHLSGEHDEAVLDGFDWALGFRIPRSTLSSGKSVNPVPGPERRPRPPPEFGDGPAPSEQDLRRQNELVDKATTHVQDTGRKKQKQSQLQVKAVEAWNLADTEAWKFVRAYDARRKVEQKQWEQEESVFQGRGRFDRFREMVT